MSARRLLNAILRILFKILLKVEIAGLENVPKQGPLILMINHINFLDPVLGVGLMPREVTPFSKIETLGYPILGFFIRLYGVVPVHRGEVDRRAIRKAIETLLKGEAFLIAPEGTRSHHGRLQPARDGIAYIALRTRAPILPVAIWGQERFFHNIKRLRRTEVHVRIGKPFRFAFGEAKVRRDNLRAMTREAMYRLASLLPPEYRGAYSDLSAATERFLRPLEGDIKIADCGFKTAISNPQSEKVTREGILRRIRDRILSCRDDVVSIVVFGSFTKGGGYNDIDLLIVVEELDKPPLERTEDALEIRDKIGLTLPMDILLLSRDECIDNFEAHIPLFLDIASDGSALYDDDFIVGLMSKTRAYIREKGIERTETGGWRFPVRYRANTPLSEIGNRDWAEIWLNDAKRDLAAATHLFEDGIFDKCVTHCQQTVEKVVKGILICFGRYEKTHYVSKALAEELEREGPKEWRERLQQIVEYARTLEPNATLSRYPGMFKGKIWVPYREYDEVKAKGALRKAKEALEVGEGFIQWWFRG